MKKILIPVAIFAFAATTGALAWSRWQSQLEQRGLASGNGRIEATEVDIATTLAGRVSSILVDEGDAVTRGQTLAEMQIDSLQAQRLEAQSEQERATQSVLSANAQVALRESEHAAMRATISLREAELDAAAGRLERSRKLALEGASSEQELDDDNARVAGARASLSAVRAQTTAARAAIDAAKAQVTGAQFSVKAAQATIQRIDASIQDSRLVAPRNGRVQFRLAQPGEVIGAGGKVLNLIDLSDAHISFFLPESASGRVQPGTEVRVVLDIAKSVVIPGEITFVSNAAQFTPKTVETADERQRLMFRVKARLSPDALSRQIAQVKTGLAGVAWVKLDNGIAWPDHLQLAPNAQ